MHKINSFILFCSVFLVANSSSAGTAVYGQLRDSFDTNGLDEVGGLDSLSGTDSVSLLGVDRGSPAMVALSVEQLTANTTAAQADNAIGGIMCLFYNVRDKTKLYLVSSTATKVGKNPVVLSLGAQHKFSLSVD